MYYQKPNGKHRYLFVLNKENQKTWVFNFKYFTILIILWAFIPISVQKHPPMSMLFKKRKPFQKEIRNILINKKSPIGHEYYLVYKSLVWYQANKEFIDARFTILPLKYQGIPKRFIDCPYASFITLMSELYGRKFNDMYEKWGIHFWDHLIVFKQAPEAT